MELRHGRKGTLMEGLEVGLGRPLHACMENGYQKKTGMRRWVKQTWRVLGVAACMGLHAREKDYGNERMVFLMGCEDERVMRKRFEEWRVRKRNG